MATTDIYELSKLNQDLEKKYFPIDEDILYMQIYGYLNEHLSVLMQDATIMAIEEGNEAIPINSKYEKNLLTYAVQYDINNLNAVPAHMDLMIGFIETDLEKQFENLKSNTFVVDRNCKLMIAGLEYHLDYDVIIQRQLLPSGEYGYTAKYDISNENSLSDVVNPFLAPPIIINQDRIKFIFIQCTIRQTHEEVLEKKIFSNNILENKTFDFEFDDQLADFSIESTEDGVKTLLTPIFEGMPIRNTDKKYCFYSYIDSNHIRIKFDRTSYEPKLNYDINIYLKTTTGEKGNFMYDKSKFYPVSLQSDTIDYDGLSMEMKFITDSIEGSDRKSIEEIKDILPKQILARETIINNKDIENFFNSLSSFNDKLYFYKRRDNQIERLYYAYMIIKDQNNNIIPSNTINLQIKERDFENNKDGRYSFSLRKKFKFVDQDDMCILDNEKTGDKHDDVSFETTRYIVPIDGTDQEFIIPKPDYYYSMCVYINGIYIYPSDYTIYNKSKIIIHKELYKNDNVDIEHIIELTNYDKDYILTNSLELNVDYDGEASFVIPEEDTSKYEIMLIKRNGTEILDSSMYLLSNGNKQLSLLYKDIKQGETINIEYFDILYGIYTEDIPVKSQDEHNMIVQYDNQKDFMIPISYPLNPSIKDYYIINFKIDIYYNTKLLDPKDYLLSNDHKKITLNFDTKKDDNIDIYFSIDTCDPYLYSETEIKTTKVDDDEDYNINIPISDSKYDIMVVKHNGIIIDTRLYKIVNNSNIIFTGFKLLRDDIIEFDYYRKKDNITHIYTENIGYTEVEPEDDNKTIFAIPIPSKNHYNELTNIKIDVSINNILLTAITDYTLSNDHRFIILKKVLQDNQKLNIGIKESYYDYKYYKNFYNVNIKAEQDQSIFNIEYPDDEFDLMIIKHNNDILYEDAYIFTDNNNKINIIGMAINKDDDINLSFYKKVDYDDSQELNMDTLEKENFLYAIPFTTVISMNPLTVSYYLINLDKLYHLKYPYINQNATIQFIATEVNLRRMDLEDPDYIFTVTLQQNISMDKGLVVKDKTTDKITQCNIKPFLTINNEDKTYYVQGVLTEADLDLYNYTFEFRLKTDGLIDENNRIRVDKLKIGGYQDPIESYAYLLQELNISMYVFAKFDVELGRDASDIIFGNKQNKGFTLCNKFDISEKVRLLYNFSNIIQSTVLVDNVESTGEYQFTIKHIPAIKFSYLQDITRYEYILEYLEYRKAFIDASLDVLENSFSVDLKFFNTYGKSRLFTIGRKQQETLDKPNLTLSFDLKLKAGADNFAVEYINSEIKSYVENINNNIYSIHMSNLCTDIKNKFDSDIEYIEFTGVNKYNSLYQYIEKQDIEEVQTVPEFLNINLINNETPDINISLV